MNTRTESHYSQIQESVTKRTYPPSSSDAVLSTKIRTITYILLHQEGIRESKIAQLSDKNSQKEETRTSRIRYTF